MAGSLNHIVTEGGLFDMDMIEVMGDAYGALEECHQIIAELLSNSPDPAFALRTACERLAYPVPKAVPVIEPHRGGRESVYLKPPGAF